MSLGDAALSHADLALLVPPAWLNDNLISFWVEHLRLHVLKDDDRVCVLPPNISFFLALCQDEQDAGALLKDLNLKQHDLVLVTVNDATATDFDSGGSRERGSHWSLVVYEKGSDQVGTFFYLDSMPCDSNRRVAAQLIAKLRRLLGLNGTGFVNVVVPMQDNVYDCGAYVCMFAEHVIRNFKKGHSTSNLYKRIRPPTSDDVGNLRQEIGKLACRILDEQQRGVASTDTPTRK